jgi:carbon storage regulator
VLVLERRVGETIIIGDDIHIRVLAIRGKIVRLGVTAPPSVGVYRTELYERIRQEQAGTGAAADPRAAPGDEAPPDPSARDR